MFIYADLLESRSLKPADLKALKDAFTEAEIPPTMEVCKLDDRYVVVHVDEDFEEIAVEIIENHGFVILP
jgi:hypothetical protein